MKERARQVHRIIQPIRSLAQRFTYLGLIGAAFGAMLLGKADLVVLDRLRAHITDVVAPIFEAISGPIAFTASAVREIQYLSNLESENDRLREDNARLIGWQAVARHLEAENEALRGMLNFKTGPESSTVSARVIADTGGAFAHSLVLNAGSNDGVRKGSPVVTGDGLVGRVLSVGARSARVLLLTDLNSRTPVLVESTGTRAILAGDNSGRLKLIHLPSGAYVAVGDRIVTSGHGGVFPPRLPAGVVVSVDEAGIRVQPFADRSRLEYVLVIDVGLEEALRLPQLPIERKAVARP